jgi:hypothetical protein
MAEHTFEDLLNYADQIIAELTKKASDREQGPLGQYDLGSHDLIDFINEAVALFKQARTKIRYEKDSLILLTHDLKLYLGIISDMSRNNDVIHVGSTSQSVDKAIADNRRLFNLKDGIDMRLKELCSLE